MRNFPNNGKLFEYRGGKKFENDLKASSRQSKPWWIRECEASKSIYLLAPIVQRRSAGPALEGSAERADFRIAQEKGDLGQRVFGVFQVFDSKPSTRVIDQRFKFETDIF
jgi:hypothetical protein